MYPGWASWLEVGKRLHQIPEEILGAADGAFELLSRYFNDVAIIEAITQLVHIIESSPSGSVPVESVGEALEHRYAMPFASGGAVTTSLECGAGEPKGCTVCRGKASRRAVRFLTGVRDAVFGAGNQAIERLPVRRTWMQ